MSWPWEISSTWKWSMMGEVAEIIGGGTPKTDHPEFYGGEIPWITPADLSGYTQKFISRGARSITQKGIDNSSARLMPSGTVLFSSRAPIGYVVIAANPVSTNQGFKSFILRDGIIPDFVYYYLQYAKKLAIELASGTTFLEISAKKAAQIPIPVPPVDEQHRIVAEIEKQFTRLEAGVAALKRVQANLKRYRAAVLKAACEGKLVPTEAELHKSGSGVPPLVSNSKEKRGKRQDAASTSTFETGEQLLQRILSERRKRWNESNPQSEIRNRKYKEPATPDTADLPPLPEGWTWAQMETVCTKVQDGTHFSPKEQTVSGDFKYVTAKNVKFGRLDLSNITYVSEQIHREIYMRCNPEKGDVLLIKDGVTTGTAAINTLEEEFSLLSSVSLLKPLRIGLLPGFLVCWLNSPVGFKAITGQMTGSAIKRIILEKIKKAPVPLPPLSEQTRIVEEVERRLSVVVELEALVTGNLQRADQLRRSILQKAFAGELVVQESLEMPAKVIAFPRTERRKRSNSHFARALLSAEIVHRLHREPTFGRIKHQKILHLCEHIAQIEEIKGQYHREAAGPLDNRLLYTNEAELKKQRWYKEVPRNSFGHDYEPMEKAGGHRKYFERYWPDKLSTIEKLIELMRKWDTEQCEIFCTVYAAWNDLILWGKPETEDNILHEILDNWHECKRRISEDRWRKAIAWMKKQGFIPTGFGKPTKKTE